MNHSHVILLRTYAIIYALSVVILVGCGPQAKEKTFKQTELNLGPRLTDTKIDTSLIESKSADSYFLRPGASVYLGSSAEIFEFIETMYDLAAREVDPTRRKGYFDLAEKTRRSFYAEKLNYTTFDADSSTYLELALGLTYDSPPNPLKDLIEGELTTQQKKLAEALNVLKLQFQPQEKGEVSIGATILEIATFLESIPAHLNASGVKLEISNQIAEKLTRDYIPILKKSSAELMIISESKSVVFNTAQIQQTLAGFTILPDQFIQPLLKELDPPKRIGSLLSNSTTAERIFDVLFELWSLPNVNRSAFRSANEDLYNFLNELSPEDLAWLKEYNHLHIEFEEEPTWWGRRKISMKISAGQLRSPNLTTKLWFAKWAVEDVGVENVKNMLSIAVNGALIREFDAKLRSYADLLVRMVATTVLAEVDKSFKGILTNLKDVLRIQGKKELRARMFKSETEFHGIEDANARLTLSEDWKWKAESNKQNEFLRRGLQADKEAVLTGSKTIGLAISTQLKRLMLRESLGMVDPKSDEYQQDIFVVINKLMAIGGFRYMESDRPRFNGLFRKIQGPNADYDMDMFNYDLEPGFFAVPDVIVIKDPFQVVPSETRSQGLLASVGGSAELSRGAGLLMYYMRDWVRNGFDAAMSLQQYQGVKIFPKDAFYALGMGVGSVPLRNLTRNGTIAFGNSGKTYESEVFAQPQDNTTMNCPEPEGVRDAKDPTAKPDPVIAAALVNITPGGRGDIVDIRDLARFVLSSDQFIRSTDNVERTTARPLKAQVNGFPVTLKAVMCGRRSVKTLMIGLANFMLSRMQLKDGGFARYYSLKEKKIIAERVFDDSHRTEEARFLEDQLLVIQALRKVYDRWQGNAYRDSAIDTYYFMNAKLYSPRLGYYRFVDADEREQPLDLRLLAMTLETLSELEPLLAKGPRQQMTSMFEVWSRKLIEFGHRTK